MLEAIALCEDIAGKKLQYNYTNINRSGDHIWYISDVRKFQHHYPEFQYKYDLKAILQEIYTAQVSKLASM